MMVNLVVNLLKTQALAGLYKQQLELSALLGDGTVRPDSAALPAFALVNCAIESVRELSFAGEEAEFAVTCKGYYLVNSNLWNL
jgi:hypothetical protein